MLALDDRAPSLQKKLLCQMHVDSQDPGLMTHEKKELTLGKAGKKQT